MEKFDCVILGAGDWPESDVARDVLAKAGYVCCCDGAAAEYLQHGRVPNAIIGDGDSLPEEIAEKYKIICHHVAEQESNDLTKATRFCLGMGFRRIAYIGCTGRREDHTIGNIALLLHYLGLGVEAIMFTDYGSFTPACGRQVFPSFPGEQVSIFRGRCTTLSSTGLRWNAYPFDELWQGTLNEALGDSFTIDSDGTYIIYRTYGNKN